MVDGNGKSHDAGGRFAAGNGGGPGRPPKRKALDDATLHELMGMADFGPDLYIAAMMLDQRADWLERIDQMFPKVVSDRIKTLVAIADLSRKELVRRLRDLPS